MRRFALILSGLYFVFALLYTELSTFLTRIFSVSVFDAWLVEAVKGGLFVILTTGLLFSFSLRIFRKVESSQKNLLSTQQLLLQVEREAVAGGIASSIAHDINNILTLMRLHAEKLRQQINIEDGALETFENINKAITRLAQLTERLRATGKSLPHDQLKSYNVSATVRESLEFLRYHQSVRSCRLEFSSSGEIWATGYALLIHQILLNLVINAAEATSGSGKIHIGLTRANDGIILTVEDNGPGIPVEKRRQVFEAFYTTKKQGHGLGLKSVLESTLTHHGQVELTDSNLGGALFTISLPDLSLQT